MGLGFLLQHRKEDLPIVIYLLSRGQLVRSFVIFIAAKWQYDDCEDSERVIRIFSCESQRKLWPTGIRLLPIKVKEVFDYRGQTTFPRNLPLLFSPGRRKDFI